MTGHLKIALIGYGKMGKLIETVATERGHQIVSRISSSSGKEEWDKLKLADVAIEFTSPHAAVNNIRKCFDVSVPVVVGSTGWYDELPEMSSLCVEKGAGLLTASNFSIGVNLFFHINKILAAAMNKLPDYSVRVEEIHHTKKLDAPSGTAITIAQGILSEISRKERWALSGQTKSETDLEITAIRKDDVPGTHSVIYGSEIDEIEIKHTAHNRLGFATGAVVAAEWMAGKKGVYTMSDIIGF